MSTNIELGKRLPGPPLNCPAPDRTYHILAELFQLHLRVANDFGLQLMFTPNVWTSTRPNLHPERASWSIKRCSLTQQPSLCNECVVLCNKTLTSPERIYRKSDPACLIRAWVTRSQRAGEYASALPEKGSIQPFIGQQRKTTPKQQARREAATQHGEVRTANFCPFLIVSVVLSPLSSPPGPHK